MQTDLANELPRVPLLFQRTDSTGREMLMERDDSQSGLSVGFRCTEMKLDLLIGQCIRCIPFRNISIDNSIIFERGISVSNWRNEQVR